MSLSKKSKAKKSKDLNGYILVGFCLLYLIAGYVSHNTLLNISIMNATDRVNNCNKTQDIVICLNYFQPRGWEKLVRF